MTANTVYTWHTSTVTLISTSVSLLSRLKEVEIEDDIERDKNDDNI